MNVAFVEMPAFERLRSEYLDDDGLRQLQRALSENPRAGDVISGTGGLRKVRWPDSRRGKGKRGGLRVIYYWWVRGSQIWLFSLYDKDQMSDLSPKAKKAFKEIFEQELARRIGEA